MASNRCMATPPTTGFPSPFPLTLVLNLSYPAHLTLWAAIRLAFQRRAPLTPPQRPAQDGYQICSFGTYIYQPSTYIASNYNYDQLVRKHLLDVQRWNIYIPPLMEQLPTMYWLPKLHKNPYGSRFIAASNKCSTMLL